MADDDFDFGDSEPEDAWDADDSIAEQVDNIRRRIELLRRSVGPMATAREQLRFQEIDVDLKFIVQRVLNG